MTMASASLKGEHHNNRSCMGGARPVPLCMKGNNKGTKLIDLQSCSFRSCHTRLATYTLFWSQTVTWKWVPDPTPFSVHSAAILRYLVAKHDLPDHWYPTDIQQRAKVNQYLSWHLSNLRVGAAGTLFLKVWHKLASFPGSPG